MKSVAREAVHVERYEQTDGNYQFKLPATRPAGGWFESPFPLIIIDYPIFRGD
jgi:hypothetical protein